MFIKQLAGASINVFTACTGLMFFTINQSISDLSIRNQWNTVRLCLKEIPVNITNHRNKNNNS